MASVSIITVVFTILKPWTMALRWYSEFKSDLVLPRVAAESLSETECIPAMDELIE